MSDCSMRAFEPRLRPRFVTECRDCRHWLPMAGSEGYGLCARVPVRFGTDGSDYCSKAEEKDDKRWKS